MQAKTSHTVQRQLREHSGNIKTYIAWLALKISGSATAISLLLGILLGITLATSRFAGRSMIAAMVNTGMGLPPVVVGLFVSMFL